MSAVIRHDGQSAPSHRTGVMAHARNLHSGMSLRELVFWLVAMLAASHAMHVLNWASPAKFADSLASANIIYFVACAAVFYRLHSSDRSLMSDAGDVSFALLIALFSCLLAFVGYRFTNGILMSAVGLYLIVRHGNDADLKAAAFVLLALAVHLVWAPAAFQYFAVPLLRLDALLVSGLYGLVRPDIVMTGTSFSAPDGHTITLAAACSSFNNMSMAVLCAVSVIMLVRNSWRRSDVALILATSLAMLAFNVVRVGLIGWSKAYHAFWHDGIGDSIFALAMTAVLLTVSYRGAIRREAGDA